MYGGRVGPGVRLATLQIILGMVVTTSVAYQLGQGRSRPAPPSLQWPHLPTIPIVIVVKIWVRDEAGRFQEQLPSSRPHHSQETLSPGGPPGQSILVT